MQTRIGKCQNLASSPVADEPDTRCSYNIRIIKAYQKWYAFTSENYEPAVLRIHPLNTSLLNVWSPGKISKRGNTILRTRLYNAAMVAVLHPNQFQAYFQKKKSEGKPYRVALVATMNKMTRVIHAVWRKKEPYHEP